jgi:hypothetical protein
MPDPTSSVLLQNVFGMRKGLEGRAFHAPRPNNFGKLERLKILLTLSTIIGNIKDFWKRNLCSFARIVVDSV